MNAYFARPMAMYGNLEDSRCITLINKLGFAVAEITNSRVQADYKTKGMAVFLEMVEKSDALFFKSFLDGKIGAGVSKEIEHAKKKGIPVLELPTLLPSRMLSTDATREYLTELGAR
jgi:hypothetical protein